ncbi:MAG: SRPBCC family protein [Actinobacteria bacterium]|nr:SRPBCC family protein [Actinomycetota bacterium]
MKVGVGAGLVLVGAATAYFRVLRPWHMHWGATAEEASGEVAGDELMPAPDIVSTRVVEVDAPPSAIWPWLVQMGPGRGGAYTYDWIERRLGINIRNTDRVIPELQHLKVGDEIEMPGYMMRVERLDPGQAMVVRSSNHAWVWSFELRPAQEHTRLISRNRFDISAVPLKDKLAYPVIEPGSWVMERKMLLTIKQRAERLARAQTTA